MHKKDIIIGLVAALMVAGFFSWFASLRPDGLERVAHDKGFLDRQKTGPGFASPLPDYSWPKVKNARLAVSAAGIAGTLIVFASGYAIAALIRRQKRP